MNRLTSEAATASPKQVPKQAEQRQQTQTQQPATHSSKPQQRRPSHVETGSSTPAATVPPPTSALNGLADPTRTPIAAPVSSPAVTPFFTPPSSSQKPHAPLAWVATPVRPGWQPEKGSLLENEEEEQLEFKSVFADEGASMRPKLSNVAPSSRASSVFTHEAAMSRLPSDGLRAGKHLALLPDPDQEAVAGLEEEFV